MAEPIVNQTAPATPKCVTPAEQNGTKPKGTELPKKGSQISFTVPIRIVEDYSPAKMLRVALERGTLGVADKLNKLPHKVESTLCGISGTVIDVKPMSGNNTFVVTIKPDSPGPFFDSFLDSGVQVEGKWMTINSNPAEGTLNVVGTPEEIGTLLESAN